MATPAPAPAVPVELKSYLVSVRPEAATLAVVSTGATPAEALKNAAALMLQAIIPPTDPPTFGASTQPLAVEVPPPLGEPPVRRGPGRPPKNY